MVLHKSHVELFTRPVTVIVKAATSSVGEYLSTHDHAAHPHRVGGIGQKAGKFNFAIFKRLLPENDKSVTQRRGCPRREVQPGQEGTVLKYCYF